MTSPTDTTPQDTSPSAVDIVAQFAESRGIQALAEREAVAPPPEAAPAVEAPAPEPEKPADNPLDRLARKDALYQQERNRARTLEQERDQLRKEHEAFIARLTSDPMAVLRERNVRFGDLALTALAAADGKPAEEPKKGATLPPEVAALQAQLEELKAWKASQETERQQATVQQQREAQVGLVRDYLSKKADDFPMVIDGDHFGQVLELIGQHVGQHGGFADDREAEETLEFYARQVESQHQKQLDAMLAKPGYKALLAKRLGQPVAQTPATPARQEIQGVSAVRNPAAAITHDLASQVSTPASQAPETVEEMMARTQAEMQRIYNANRGAA